MSANTTDIEAAIVDIIRNDLAVNLPVIDGSSQLVGDLGLDSVAFAVALVAIEERLDIRLSQRELIECVTVADVLQTVSRHKTLSIPVGRLTA